MALVRDIYTLTEGFPQTETFGLMQQMRRAAVSVPSNIAEGHGRGSDKSFAFFLRQARGSLNELETQMELARQLAISPKADYSPALQEIDEIERMLTAFVLNLKKTDPCSRQHERGRAGPEQEPSDRQVSSPLARLPVDFRSLFRYFSRFASRILRISSMRWAMAFSRPSWVGW